MPDDEPGPPKVNSLVVLAVGLHIAGYKSKRLSKRSQIKRFKSMYGTYPIVVQRLFDQLSGTLSDKKVKLDHVFWALFFLRKYPKEDVLATKLQKDPVTLRKWIWTLFLG